ncbi:hypothetical protein ACTQ6A_15410 [Lachnospiraceae bacterium LCP25S3_G4]
MMAWNMRVMMDNGVIKSMSQIQIGDKILTCGKNIVSVKNIEYEINHRVILQLTTEAEHLFLCTPEQRICTVDGIKKASDVKAGMSLSRIDGKSVKILEVQWILNEHKVWNISLEIVSSNLDRYIVVNGYFVEAIVH